MEQSKVVVYVCLLITGRKSGPNDYFDLPIYTLMHTCHVILQKQGIKQSCETVPFGGRVNVKFCTHFKL